MYVLTGRVRSTQNQVLNAHVASPLLRHSNIRGFVSWSSFKINAPFRSLISRYNKRKLKFFKCIAVPCCASKNQCVNIELYNRRSLCRITHVYRRRAKTRLAATSTASFDWPSFIDECMICATCRSYGASLIVCSVAVTDLNIRSLRLHRLS